MKKTILFLLIPFMTFCQNQFINADTYTIKPRVSSNKSALITDDINAQNKFYLGENRNLQSEPFHITSNSRFDGKISLSGNYGLSRQFFTSGGSSSLPSWSYIDWSDIQNKPTSVNSWIKVPVAGETILGIGNTNTDRFIFASNGSRVGEMNQYGQLYGFTKVGVNTGFYFSASGNDFAYQFLNNYNLSVGGRGMVGFHVNMPSTQKTGTYFFDVAKQQSSDVSKIRFVQYNSTAGGNVPQWSIENGISNNFSILKINTNLSTDTTNSFYINAGRFNFGRAYGMNLSKFTFGGSMTIQGALNLENYKTVGFLQTDANGLVSVNNTLQSDIDGKVTIATAQNITGIKTFQHNTSSYMGYFNNTNGSGKGVKFTNTGIFPAIEVWQDLGSTAGVQLWANGDGDFDGYLRTRYFKMSNGAGVNKILQSDATGLGVWIDNTSLPISTATQSALDLKLNTSTASSTYIPFSGGTLTGALTLSNSVRVGGTGSTDNNTFLGKNTLISRTTGTGNTAIGQASLSSSTSGSNNTVVGSNSGASLTTGQGNTIIGNGLASAITTGSYNTIIGAGSITGLTSGSSNNVIIADGQGNRRLNIFSDGNAMIGSNTYYGETRLGVFGGVNGANLDIRGNSGAFVDQSTVEVEGNDYDTNTRSAYLQYRGSTYTGTSNGFSNNNLARLVMNGNNNLIMTGLTKPLIFGTNFTEAMRIDSLGRIGIGTTSPYHNLQVGAGTFTSQINPSIQILAANSTDARVGAAIGNGKTTVLRTSGTFGEVFSYDYGGTVAQNLILNQYGGNVGIGTTTPSATLDINGYTRFRGLVEMPTNSDFTQNLYYSSGWKYRNAGYAGDFYQNASGDYIFSTAPTGVADATATLTSRMIIQNGGNVGIGTTNPAGKLVISSVTANTLALDITANNTASQSFGMRLYGGTNTNDYALRVKNIADTQEYFFIRGDGNVGIGTTSPLAKLDNRGDIHVSNGSTTKTRIRTGGIIDFTNFAESAYADASITANNLSLLGGSGVGAYITNAGNFGVGISSPSSKLHVYGTGYVAATIQTTATNAGAITNYITGSRSYSIGGRSDFATGAFHIVDETAAASRFMINSSGNVGVGTTSPSQKLQVAGYGKFDSGIIGGSAGLTIYGSESSSNGVFLTTAGNFGIGTTNPATILHAATVSQQNLISVESSNATPTLAGITKFGQNNRSGLNYRGEFQLLLQSFNGTSYYDNEVLTAKHDGKIGIGVSTPNATLDVYSGVNSSAGQFNSAVSARKGGNSYEFGHPNTSGYGSSIGANSGNGFSFIAFNAETGTTTNTYKTRGILGRIITNDVNTNTLIFGRATNLNADNQSITNDLTINSSGNVGVGTTSPTNVLSVVGGTAITNGWTRTMSLQSTFPVMIFNSTAVSKYAGIGYDGTTNMNFWVNGSSEDVSGTGITAMSIKSATGHIGIGTTSPNAPLQFASTTANRKIVLYEGANTDHQFYGFGLNSNTLRYQVNLTTDAHTFYAGTSPTTSAQLFSIKGNGTISHQNLTTAQINALTGMSAGDMAYNSDLNMFVYYNGTGWKRMHDNSNM